MWYELKWETEIGPIFYLYFKKYKIGLCFCHRRKDRSIWFFGLEKIFCARCLGIFLGGLIAVVIYKNSIILPSSYAIVCIIPLVVDGLIQGFFQRESNNYLRLLTGGLFGIGFLMLFYQI